MIKNLSIKIIGIVFLITSVIFVCLLYLNIRSYSEGINSSFVERARSTTGSVEANIENMEDARNKTKLLSSINKHIWLNPDILNINFNLLQNGNLVTYVSSNQSNINKQADDNNLQSLDSDIIINQTIETSPKILRVVTPLHISGKTQGTIQIEFTLENVEAKIRSNIIALMLYFITMMLLFILLLFIFLRLIVIKPIAAINKGVDAILNNNFDYQVNLKSDDEIGKLSQAFDKMAKDLKESKVKLRTYTQKLEEEVTQRTRELEESKKKLENINLDLESKVKERTKELEKLKNSLEITVAQRTTELNQKLDELERMNKLMVGREMKMVELKKEMEEMKSKPASSG